MKPSILCIDDEPDITEAVRLNLLSEDIDLDIFNDPREGIEAAKQKEYHVALVDIRMPGMTGIEFMSTLKEMSPRTVRINMSSHADLEVVLEALGKNHVYDFIKKPFKRDKFLAVIRKAISLALLSAERDQLSEHLKEKNAQLEDWNKRLDEEVQKKTLELDLRDRLMQHLAGCSEAESNSYDLIKEYFSSFYSQASVGLYLKRETSLQMHDSFVNDQVTWVEKVDAQNKLETGEVGQGKISEWINDSKFPRAYLFALERNGRSLGALCLALNESLNSQCINSIRHFSRLVSLVVYDELASERLSELSFSSLLKEE